MRSAPQNGRINIQRPPFAPPSAVYQGQLVCRWMDRLETRSRASQSFQFVFSFSNQPNNQIENLNLKYFENYVISLGWCSKFMSFIESILKYPLNKSNMTTQNITILHFLFYREQKLSVMTSYFHSTTYKHRKCQPRNHPPSKCSHSSVPVHKQSKLSFCFEKSAIFFLFFFPARNPK